MYNFVLLFLLIFNMPTSFAGNEVGNGGVGFWCPQTKKYLLLDFYEYELLNPKHKIIATNENDLEKILNERLKILSKLDEKNFNQYSLQIKNILPKINFLNDISLNKTHDSFEIAKPKGCTLKQFALQRKKEKDHITEFYFDKEIWDNLDSLNKAGLILHEIIYEQFSLLGERNSLKVRKFNSFIFSKDFKNIAPADYKIFIQDLRLPLY